jgi:hypothetical protein
MFAGQVFLNLKPHSLAEFNRTIENEVIPLLRKQKGFKDEITFVTPNEREAVGITLWDQQESAEAYNRTTFPQVLDLLARVADETPQVKTFEVSHSTIHKINARVAVQG